MTKKKKLKGDEYIHIIYPSYSHRMEVDDMGEPIKAPELNKRKKKYRTRPMRQYLEAHHLKLYNVLHPGESASPEPVVEAEKQQSKTHRRKRERRQRRSAKKHA